MSYVLYKGKKRPRWIFDQGNPSSARKVYHNNSLREAAKDFCKDCAGSAIEARRCECDYCPLWPFRPGVRRGEKPSCAPSLSELTVIEEEMAAARAKGLDTLSICEPWTLKKEEELSSPPKKAKKSKSPKKAKKRERVRL